MNNTIYLFCQGLVILTTFFIVAFTTYGLRRALLEMRVDMRKQNQLVKWVFWGLVAWLFILGLLSIMGFYANFDVLPPRIFLFGVFPPLVTAIFLCFSKPFAVILKHISPRWLIEIQSFRIVVEIILWLGFIGSFVPFQMTFQGFNMDIIAGVTACFAGIVFFGKSRVLKPESIIWNIFGIFLLINILFIATISTPSPFQIFKNEPVNTFIAAFPFIWIPGFLVPFALAMHLFSLKQVLVIERKKK